VTDLMSGFPIAGVQVIYSSAFPLVNTAEDRTYGIGGLPAGEYMIRFEAPGYETVERSVVLEVNAEFELNVQLNMSMPVPPAP